MAKIGRWIAGIMPGRRVFSQEEGARQETPDISAELSADDSREGWLQYQENGLIVRIYLQEGVTRVGRSKHMDYSVNGPTVSRAHAEFVRRNHHYYVRDTHSTCGTYLNGSRERIADDQEFELHARDEICLGNVKMTFLLRGTSGEADAFPEFSQIPEAAG